MNVVRRKGRRTRASFASATRTIGAPSKVRREERTTEAGDVATIRRPRMDRGVSRRAVASMRAISRVRRRDRTRAIRGIDHRPKMEARGLHGAADRSSFLTTSSGDVARRNEIQLRGRC